MKDYDIVDVLVWGLPGLLVCCIFALIGSRIGEYRMWEQAISRGFASHNPTTGALEWKESIGE